MGNSLPIVTADILQILDSACFVMKSVDIPEIDEREFSYVFQVQIL